MEKVWTWVGSCSLLIACGGSGAAPSVPGAVDAAAMAPIAALKDAHHWRAEADAIGAPALPSIADQADSLAFLKGPVKDWITQKRRAVERADAAYSEAFSSLNDAELAIAQGEVGDLWGSFAGTFVELGVASIPPKIKGDATLRQAYTQAIEEAAAPQRDRARGAYQACSSADRAPTAANCQRKLAELSRRAPTASAPVTILAQPTVSSPERPWLPTRQPTPCSFAGSLRLGHAPVTLTRFGEPFAWLEQLELAKLELPAKRGEPLRLTSDWPVVATFYLSAAQLPFVLREPLELAPKHVWLGAGAAVSAAAASGKSALIYRRFPGATPDPAQVAPCAQLDLASAAHVAENPAGATLNFVGDVQLFASPSGKEVGRFSLKNPEPFEVLETQAPWRHVAARRSAQHAGGQELPYDFDAWTQLPPTREQHFGMIGLLINTAEPTHVVTRELELFTAPKETSQLGKLVKDAAVLVGETRDGFVNVDVPGLIRAGKDWGFWVKVDAFQSSVRQL